ncbi:MAG: ribonuclease P protein component [Bacilli bacterium]|nr:ribonuclease P protein component [Bacilli bacterium]
MKVANRIKANDEFAVTVKKGRTLRSDSYLIHFVNNDKNICRVGISVSKKLGNAVTRNRIKRQIRAMCDSLLNYEIHAIDIVIIVKEGFLNKEFSNNRDELEKLFKEIGL